MRQGRCVKEIASDDITQRNSGAHGAEQDKHLSSDKETAKVMEAERLSKKRGCLAPKWMAGLQLNVNAASAARKGLSA